MVLDFGPVLIPALFPVDIATLLSVLSSEVQSAALATSCC